MRIKKIEKLAKGPVYDLSVKDAEHYVLENGVITHNTGVYYSADNIWIIGRQQEKDSKGIKGYNFIINVEKSRHVQEKTKIPIQVTFEGGIQQWSGLLEVASLLGYVTSAGKGKWSAVDKETGVVSDEKYTTKKIMSSGEFWKTLFKNTDFKDAVEKAYSYGSTSILQNIDDEALLIE